jgi:hypothetical protein
VAVVGIRIVVAEVFVDTAAAAAAVVVVDTAVVLARTQFAAGAVGIVAVVVVAAADRGQERQLEDTPMVVAAAVAADSLGAAEQQTCWAHRDMPGWDSGQAPYIYLASVARRQYHQSCDDRRVNRQPIQLNETQQLVFAPLGWAVCTPSLK